MQVSQTLFTTQFLLLVIEPTCRYPFIVLNSKVSKYPFDRMVGAAHKEFLETGNLQSLVHFSPNMTYHNASPLKHFTNYYWMYQHFLTRPISQRGPLQKCINVKTLLFLSKNFMKVSDQIRRKIQCISP